MNEINDENNSVVLDDMPVEVKAILPSVAETSENPDSAINISINNYQLSIDDWNKHELIQSLHTWRERFIFGFKLKIEEPPVIKIDTIGRSKYGHFRPGRNGFGLRNEIAINEAYIQCRQYWQVLGTLLHELLHTEQEQTGKPGKHNYHNKTYRERAASLGLIVDEWGHMQYDPPPSVFLDFLKQYGISVPDIETGLEDFAAIAPPALASGNSKLKLWVCKCSPQPVRVRVAIADFQATCKKCGCDFIKVTE